jgi:hypothetical protein
MDGLIIHLLFAKYLPQKTCRRGSFVMAEEQEYVAGLAGSQESPTAKMANKKRFSREGRLQRWRLLPKRRRVARMS